MDMGVVFGLSGVAVGIISLVYARSQAVHVQRQADAAHRATTLEIQSDMMQRLYDVRAQLAGSSIAAAQYIEASPVMRELYRDPEQLKSAIVVRNTIDAMQDIYFLRKRGLVDDHHWRNWTVAMGPIVLMPLTRQAFENAVSRDALEPEFADFFRRLLDGHAANDPVRLKK